MEFTLTMEILQPTEKFAHNDNDGDVFISEYDRFHLEKVSKVVARGR